MSNFTNFSEIKDEIDRSFPGENLSITKYHYEKVSKYDIKTRIHKHKPYISKINCTCLMKWAKIMEEWLSTYYVLFSDKCKFSLVSYSWFQRV